MKGAHQPVAPRPWFGRNAGIRPRLVLIVGIAMLAPGALAVLQAIASYNASMRALEQNLAQAAQLAASEELTIIGASREILTSLAAHPDVRVGVSPPCRRALQRAIGGLDQYRGAVVVNAQGEIICSSDVMNSIINVSDRKWFQDVMSGDPFIVSDLLVSRWPGGWGVWTASPLIDDAGVIQGAIGMFMGLEWLTRRYQGQQDEKAAFALLDRTGVILSGAQHLRTRSPMPSKQLIDEQLTQIAGQETVTFSARGHDGEWRLYAVSPLLEGRVFVILGTPVLTAIGPLALQVAWGVATPLLMWALGIAVVWFGLEHLVIRWISYLERITSAYGSGRLSVRPERAATAPAEIRSLAETFSRMADVISAREGELRESLAQKEVLMREVHHRVKNNMQLVMSLLNLHARRIRDPRAEAAFAEARGRINALATLHRRLYESETLQEVDLKWFIDDLCAELRRGGLERGRHIELRAHAPGEIVGADIAAPLGLLVTEAITNAYKHAFSEGDGGHIHVEVIRESPETLLLRVQDDGVGIESESGSEGDGLGRSLIEAFARQLRGELKVLSEQGTTIEVRFPARETLRSNRALA